MENSLTVETAQPIILPWYGLFNVKTRGSVRDVHQQVVAADYQSSAGFLPGESWGLETSIAVIENFAKSIPDLEFMILELLVSGDRVIVRGEVTGTPSGELFGTPHSGKSFRIMALDLHTVSDGRISRTFHMENWLSALGQLRST
jgi:predicted ester cyclase